MTVQEIIYLVLLVVLAVSPSADAQTGEASPAYEARVEVKVDARELSERVQSCLQRELSQLPGVIVVDKNPGWVLSVVGYELKLGRESEAVGAALSVVVLEPADLRWLREAESTITDVQERARFSRALGNVIKEWYLFKDQRLYAGAVPDLEATCKTMAAAFDKDYLAPERQRFRSLTDRSKK